MTKPKKTIQKDFLMNYILAGNYSNEGIEYLLERDNMTRKQLIKKCFKMLTSLTSSIHENPYYITIISHLVCFISYLCSLEDMNKEEIEINRKRIKGARENILVYLKKHDNQTLLEAANGLDEIILDKNIDVNSLIVLIKDLIDRREDVDIIKKFINANKESILRVENGLFDFVFNKAIEAIRDKSRDIYYYITLLKIVYNSKLKKKKYFDLLSEFPSDNNIFVQELYMIVSGIKRGLTCEEILDKYVIEDTLPEKKITISKTTKCDLKPITIDGNRTFLRDDALSIKKDGNKFIVGIHIADAGRHIEPNGIVDLAARNNFTCSYLHGGRRVHMFTPALENQLSLNKNKVRGVISLYVIMNDSGEMLDYYIKQDDIIVSENLSYLQSDSMLDYLSNSGFEFALNQLFYLASALEDRQRQQYWKKKEASKPNSRFKNTKSDVIVREFMVLYNQIIATTMKNEGHPYIYRIQDDEYISELAKVYGMHLDDYTSRVIESIYLESVYSTEPRRHLGLNFDIYSHSCDPLRRYPDLYNQYLLHHFLLKDKEMNFDSEYFRQLVEYSNQRAAELSLMKAEFNREARLIRKK